ncbi:YrdB family protein [Nocardia sp. CWNU-33]|uniref:YrdB family protein n=1 Tax=Nocardia sp. CWNU-33 TaxID=3392117 RepID=UPI00398ED509
MFGATSGCSTSKEAEQIANPATVQDKRTWMALRPSRNLSFRRPYFGAGASFRIPGPTRIVAGLGAPALFTLMWALFGTGTTARFQPYGGWRLALELLWFGGGALAWYQVAGPIAGVGFFAMWAITAAVRAGAQGGLIVDIGQAEVFPTARDRR